MIIVPSPPARDEGLDLGRRKRRAELATARFDAPDPSYGAPWLRRLSPGVGLDRRGERQRLPAPVAPASGLCCGPASTPAVRRVTLAVANALPALKVDERPPRGEQIPGRHDPERAVYLFRTTPVTRSATLRGRISDTEESSFARSPPRRLVATSGQN